MSLKFGQIQPSSAELAAIERLKKKSPHTYNGKNCVATFSQQLPFLIILAGSDATHKLG